MPDQNQKTWTDYVSTTLWIVILLVSFIWWRVAGQGAPLRMVLITALSLASFIVGCFVGFLFTSYGEKAGTVGKIRDWLIGGITGVTIAKAAAIKGLLTTFQATPSGTGEYALTLSAAVVYAILGFFFMFFQTELVLNVLLAEGRAQRGRIEGTKQAGRALKREPDYADIVRTKWIEKGGSFACFVSDKDFRSLVGLDTTPPSPTG